MYEMFKFDLRNTKERLEARAAKVRELKARLEETQCPEEKIEGVYWVVEDTLGGLVGKQNHPTKLGARLEASKIASDAVNEDRELVEEVNERFEPSEIRMEFCRVFAEYRTKYFVLTPYCEIDGIKYCLRGADIPEEILK